MAREFLGVERFSKMVAALLQLEHDERWATD
jgi:hypothetical protein